MSYAQPHPRQSILSNSSHSSVEHFSPTASSTRFSLPTAPSIHSTIASTPRAALNRVVPNIYDRNISKPRASEVSASAYAFLFSEIVQYTQKRVSVIHDFERRLNTMGYRVGTRVLELLFWRNESTSKTPKREIRLLSVLIMIQTQLWKAVFGKAADGVEKSHVNVDEYMVIDNDPILERHISVPKDLAQLCCSSFTAGVVEAFLDGLNFPARVTAHHTPSSQHPSKVTILIKVEKSVLDREELMNK